MSSVSRATQTRNAEGPTQQGGLPSFGNVIAWYTDAVIAADRQTVPTLSRRRRVAENLKELPGYGVWKPPDLQGELEMFWTKCAS